MKTTFSKMVLGPIVLAILAFGCAHEIQKADIPTTANPTDEAQKLSFDIGTARENNTDVLDYTNYHKAQTFSERADKGLKDGDKQESVLDKVAYGRAYLDSANRTADNRRGKWQPLLKTRAAAVSAGARNNPQNDKELGRIDDDLKSEVESSSEITADNFSKLQNRYMNLELAALKTTNLGDAKAKIEGMRSDHRAKADAPWTLHQAEVDYANAENVISANRKNPEAYKAAVNKANKSAQFLVDVITVAHQNPKTLDENTAIGIVKQNHKMSALQDDVSEAQGVANTRAQELGDQRQQLATQKSHLDKAEATIGMQEAIDKARQEFTADEADVFQQGNKLLIRLKSLNFPSGRSDLPATAMPILAKVESVTADLKPQAVMVEGHTDSVGTAKVNEALSEKRAEAVASYLRSNGIDKDVIKTEGFGFDKPIASNKTTTGRSQNRRVDVIITPSQASSKETSDKTSQE